MTIAQLRFIIEAAGETLAGDHLMHYVRVHGSEVGWSFVHDVTVAEVCDLIALTRRTITRCAR